MDIKLGILKVNSTAKPGISMPDDETCAAWGSVKFTGELDFREITFAESMLISIYLKPEKFDKIIELAKTKKIDQIGVSIGRVRGFYSDWSPSISTPHV